MKLMRSFYVLLIIKFQDCIFPFLFELLIALSIVIFSDNSCDDYHQHQLTKTSYNYSNIGNNIVLITQS